MRKIASMLSTFLAVISWAVAILLYVGFAIILLIAPWWPLKLCGLLMFISFF